MALPTVAAGKFQPCIPLSHVKLSPKIWGHHSISLANSINTLTQACLAAKTNQEVHRPLANFSPTIWKDTTIFTSNLPASEIESNDRVADELKQKVKEMLIAPTNDPAEKVCLIDSICRLGVSYHFENEIEEQLNQIFEAQPNFTDDNDYDLYTIALLFRVFRQHGYKISCGVFNKFKDGNGMFNRNMTSDARGILSFYEATHLRVQGEDILEEALDFTTNHLKSLAKSCPNHLEKHIINALELPLHKGVPRLEAYKYIPFYQEDLSECRNETLLVFAKLDFNRVQLLHRQELSHLTSWWKDLNLASNYSYSRDRIVEIYFWASSLYFEPCYSRARITLSKILMIHTVVDDTYDAYGTLEELQRFTSALQRWDINAVGDLPDYMKNLYSVLLNLYDEFDDEASKEGRSYCVSCTKDSLKDLLKAYLVEAEWFCEGFVPSFEERLNHELVPGSCCFYTAASFVGMGDIAGIHEFEWLKHCPKIDRDAYIIGRLKADLAAHEYEQKRGHAASTVECYMKQYGISKEETVEKFNTIIADAWKDINEQCMKPTAVSLQLLLSVVNSARALELFYMDKDGYTCPEILKDYITKLFIDPIHV